MPFPQFQTFPLKGTYVSLDLETTGLSADRDDIIEVGAVKFQGDAVLSVFQTLVNPYRDIPGFVQQLTGIGPRDVEKAPPFAAIASDFIGFVGSCPLVGHNVAFDLGFLSSKGVSFVNPNLDTAYLAAILLPGASEYSLAPLAYRLGISHPRPHRALPDARVTGEVFLALLNRALELDLDVLGELHRLGVRSDSSWASLLEGLVREKESRASTRGSVTGVGGVDLKSLFSKAPRSKRLRPPSKPNLLNAQELKAFFATEGPLAKALKEYESRPQQVEMALAVAKAFNEKGTLVVEAGTGVGKSLAYLLPAVLYALRNGVRVVVSTNTIGLQEQIVRKDIPLLLEALKASGEGGLEGFRYGTLKGRSNYLCLRRWDYLRRGESLSRQEAKVAAKVLVWLKDAGKGDRGEINLNNADMVVWNRLSAQGGERCPYYQEGVCFYRQAKEQAEEADVLVVNHALLLADMATEGKLLPQYRHLVVDEAHHLEDEATRQLGFQVHPSNLDEILGRIAGPSSLVRFLTGVTATGSREQRERVLKLASELEEDVQRCRERASSFFGVVDGFLRIHKENGADRPQLRISKGTRAQPDWSKVEIAWEDLDGALNALATGLGRVQEYLEELPGEADLEGEDIPFKTASLSHDLAELKDRLAQVVVHADEEKVYWLSQESQEGAISFNGAPLDVASVLREGIFAQKDTLIFTSATLASQGGFQHFRSRIGLEQGEELLLDSPFDYEKAVLLCLPEDTPEPDAPRYSKALEDILLRVCQETHGQCMALFTSYSALNAARRGIRGSLESIGVRVLAQGIDGTPQQIVNAFTKDPNSVLLGTASFWEGVDLPGEALKVLVVTRLPFSVPTDPVFAARSEPYEDPFQQYALPQAVLRFRQGFGRLIRSGRDRGVVVVLDRRVLSKSYGKVFLDSIPQCTVVQGLAREIPSRIVAWLEG